MMSIIEHFQCPRCGAWVSEQSYNYQNKTYFCDSGCGIFEEKEIDESPYELVVQQIKYGKEGIPEKLARENDEKNKKKRRKKGRVKG